MRKSILSCLIVLFFCGQVFGAVPANMRIPTLEPPKLRPIGDTSLEETLKAMPPGLTFYKDFTRIPPGTYKQQGLLDADYSIGSPVATFTSTSGSFTITSNGYQATTANDEVLKYLIAGNRTAAQETIIIKFQMTWDISNDGIQYVLTDTDTKLRNIYKAASSATWRAKPNETDSGAVSASPSAAVLKDKDTDYIVAMICQHSSPYVSTFINGSNRVDYTTGDWTTNAWGTSFYIGCGNGGNLQFNGKIAKVWCYNRVLSMSEIALHN